MTEEAISEFLPGLATPRMDYVDYPRDLGEMVDELRTWARNAHDLKIARAHLARHIANHNREFGTALAIPPPLSRLFPDTLLRSQKWSEARRRLNTAHHQWLQGLDTQRSLNLSADARLGLLLYLAATYGGLCIPAAIDRLAEAMCKPKPIQSQHGTDIYWIDLFYQHGQFTNFTRNGVDVIYRPWLLTPMCQLAAFGFLKQCDRTSMGQAGERRPSFELITESFEQVAGFELPFSSMATFLKVAFCVVERQPGASMSELHAEYCIGRVASVGLRPSTWRQMLSANGNPV